MKKNYIIAVPFVKGTNIIEDEEVLETPKIDSIYNDIIDAEVYDHLFYINDVEELIDYDSLEDASILMFDMTKSYFDDYPEIDTVKIDFYDTDNDKLLFGVVVDSIDDDYRFSIYSYDNEEFNDDEDEDDDFECDGDCENCELHNTEESDTSNGNNIRDTFYFVFDW